MRLDVAVEIVRHEIVITMLADCGDHGTEVVRRAKRALFNLVEDLVKVGIDRVGAVSVSVAEVLDVLGEVAKEEDVAFTDFTRNLNLLPLEV